MTHLDATGSVDIPATGLPPLAVAMELVRHLSATLGAEVLTVDVNSEQGLIELRVSVGSEQRTGV